jgi:uncharacterized membrane protein YedE/YeeE
VTAALLPILLVSLLCGLVAGSTMYRADFCVTAMFRDPFLFGDTFLLRMLVLLVVASMVLFELGRLAGVLAFPFPLLGQPSLANCLGGAVFGLGMVLAGGCVVGTLYKLGAGAPASALALAGMLAGAAGYAEIHPWWAGLAESLRLTQADALTVPRWLGISPSLLVLPLAALGGAWLYGQYRQGRLVRRSAARGWLAPWRAALILAGVGLVSWALVGMPLGITTSYAKLGAALESLVFPGHVAASPYFATVPLSYTPPLSTQTVTGGPGPALDGIAAIQYPLILGIVLGSAWSARRAGALTLEALRHRRVPPRQLVSALAGGVLLGLGARLAPACNIWHLWGGLPILAMQSLLFLVGLVPGAWLGTRILARWVVR